MSRLLTEVQVDLVEIINEAKEGHPKATYIRGPFIVAETVNRNRRYYPSNIVENEVRRYNEEYIKKNRAVGELNHPQTPQINYERATHKIIEMVRDGNVWVGKAKILEGTPLGRVAKALIDEGIALGVSTRGVGSLREDKNLNANVVGDDFRLCTIDLVSDPSGPGCFVQGVLEGADWVYEASSDRWIQSQVAQLADQIKDAPAETIKRDKTQLFEQFTKLLSLPESAATIATLAARAGVNQSRAAQIWNQAKLKARAEGQADNYSHVLSLAKTMLKV